MARMWSEAGHEVTVIAGTVSLSTGETHEGARGHVLIRTLDGPVTVWRAHVPSVYSQSYMGRRLAYVVFTLTACLAAIRSGHADVVIATSPPLVVVIPSCLKTNLSRSPGVLELVNLRPD